MALWLVIARHMNPKEILMRNTMLVLSFAALTAIVSPDGAISQVRVPPPSSVGKFASERSSHKFAGATRVVLDNFDPMDKDSKSASLQLDNNDVIFSDFGEQQITAVFYKSFEVKLTRLKGADPEG